MTLNVNVGTWVRKNALIYPDKAAVKSGKRSFTYRQLGERVNRLANGLKAKGLAKGDRVALFLMNGTEYVEAVFACSAAGFIAVPATSSEGASTSVRDGSVGGYAGAGGG